MKITSDLQIRSAPPGWHTVAGARGLLLRVHAAADGSLTRGWYVRVTVDGRRPKFPLGAYPVVTLAAAPQKAIDARRVIAAGKDPSVGEKRRQRAAEKARSLTLLQAINCSPVPSYKNPKSDEIRQRALRVHFAPLHSRDVASVTAADVASILRKLADQTAIKAQIAIRRVFDYAAATLEPHGVILVNPADPRRLRAVGWSPKPQSESKQYPSLHWRATPDLVAELSKAGDVVSTCALLIVATAVRCKTARLAKWANVDFDERTWTPPFDDLKDGKHHKRSFVLPLNDVALAALEAMRGRSSSRFVFANSSGAPIPEGDITNLTRRLRRRHPDWVDAEDGESPFTFHGARASFQTFVWETHLDGDLGELSLGHKVHGDVAGRYIRTGLVEERRALLDAWSRHLRGESAKVIPIRSTG